MKVFVAGAGSIRHSIGEVIDDIKKQGHEVLDWARAPEWDMKSFDKDEIAKRDMDFLLEADALVWCLTNSTSQGAPLEAGVAYALKIPVIIFWGLSGTIPQHMVYPEYISDFPVQYMTCSVIDLLSEIEKTSSESNFSGSCKKSLELKLMLERIGRKPFTV